MKIVSQLSNLTNIQKAPEEIAFESNTSGHLHYLFSKWIMLIKNMKHVLVEPRAYGVQTMRYDVDHIGNVRGVYTQILEEWLS